jgi:hypothetical protein
MATTARQRTVAHIQVIAQRPASRAKPESLRAAIGKRPALDLNRLFNAANNDRDP